MSRRIISSINLNIPITESTSFMDAFIGRSVSAIFVNYSRCGNVDRNVVKVERVRKQDVIRERRE